ncbi:unnamed protein product, partial [Arabidopsis halleri]
MVRFVDVSDLVPTIPKKRIKVKVLRRYDGFTLFNSTLELILVDKRGTMIHAVLNKDLHVGYSEKLIEGRWFVISNFDLILAMETFRPTPHLFEIHLKTSTSVRKWKALQPKHFFAFARFQDVLDGLVNPVFGVDLIGGVMSVGNYDEDVSPDITWNQVYLELENEKQVFVHCQLPSEYSREFFDGWKTCVDNIIICVLRFAKLEMAQG